MTAGTSTVPQRPVSAGWYLVAFGLIGSALAISWTGFNQMREVVATLQRRVMPGTHELALAGGRATIYFESRSEVKDVIYEVPEDLTFGCALARPDGKSHPLVPVTAKVTYATGAFHGRAVFDVEVVAPGAYFLTCNGKQPYVVAVGGGIGAWTIVAIVGGLIPGLAGLVVIGLVSIKRRSWFLRRAREGLSTSSS